MGRAQSLEEESFELYREIAEDLCLPVDDNLEREVRYELYLSKWVYLERLRENCFVQMNQSADAQPAPFRPEDMARIQRALGLTREFIRQMIFDALRHGLAVRTAQAQAKRDARREIDECNAQDRQEAQDLDDAASGK